jgi:probable Rubsico expression protein CbbX
MFGLTKQNFKWTVVAIVSLSAVTASWSYLPHLAFAPIALLVVVLVLALIRRQYTARQTSLTDPSLSRRPAASSPKPKAASPAAKPKAASAAAKPKVASPTPKPKVASPAAGRGAARRSRKGQELLHPDARVALADERQDAGIDEVFTDLDNKLVGLYPVKNKVEEIASLLLVDRVRHRFGLDAPRPNLHMCFTGEPGTGKTTVALQMGQLLHRLGYLETGHLVHAMRDDLVGEFIGHTAPKTKRVLDRAMGGVLFIDEAYYLYRASDSKDYGQECIDILLQVMENDRDKLVVILAGYRDRMDEFFESNPGMSSRIAHHLDFAPYTQDELIAIGRAMLSDASYYLSGQAEAAFRDYLTLRMRQPRFANARSVRNELERARLRHAHRLASDPELSRTRDDLMRIESADILAGPVFSQQTSLSVVDD